MKRFFTRYLARAVDGKCALFWSSSLSSSVLQVEWQYQAAVPPRVPCRQARAGAHIGASPTNCHQLPRPMAAEPRLERIRQR